MQGKVARVPEPLLSDHSNGPLILMFENTRMPNLRTFIPYITESKMTAGQRGDEHSLNETLN